MDFLWGEGIVRRVGWIGGEGREMQGRLAIEIRQVSYWRETAYMDMLRTGSVETSRVWVHEGEEKGLGWNAARASSKGESTSRSVT